MRDTFSKEAALITTAFAAINPWHILQSRWALDCNLYPQFFVMGICFLNKSVQKDKTRHLVISMVMFGLCMYCYGVSIYTMPVFLLTACIYLLVKKKITWKKAILALLVWLLISWPFILTMAINFLKLDTIQTPFFTIPYFKDSIRSNDILFFSDQFFAQLKNNFQSLMNTTLLQRKDLPWNDVEGFGTMYLFSMPFVMTGIFALMKEYRKSAGAVFAVFFLLTGVWCGLVTNGVNVNRINIIYFPMIVMGGLGIYTVIVTCRHIKWGILGVYAISFVMFTATYFTTYADMIEYYFFQDFGKAVTSLKDSEAKKLYINIEDAPNLSEILTLFYHDIDAHYYQGNMQGNEIPFQEKYIFDCIENIEIDPLEDAQYVVKDMEIELFDASLFEFKQFGDFYVVTPRFKISADDSV